MNERKSGTSLYSHESETPFIRRTTSHDAEAGGTASLSGVNGGPRYARSVSRNAEQKAPSRIICESRPFEETKLCFLDCYCRGSGTT